MLGRRQYRIKVLQALYAYFQGGESRLEIAEKNLLHSIDKIFELYYLQFSFLLEVIHFYEYRMEESKGKFYPTPEELNPSHKLLNNRLIIQLQQNIDVKEHIKQYQFSWTEEQEMIRKTYMKIKVSKDYLAYIHSETSSFREDQDFLEKMFRKYIARSSDLQSYCEERNIHWTDDFELVAVFVHKTIKLLTESWSEKEPFLKLFDKEYEANPEDDRKFVRELFMKTALKSDELGQLIETRTRNWEIDRIALTDIILIKMALTELMHFTQIPVKVTMNEYIEISKQFSSQKSKLFINGILDKLVLDLSAENKITKTGRGLMK